MLCMCEEQKKKEGLFFLSKCENKATKFCKKKNRTIFFLDMALAEKILATIT